MPCFCILQIFILYNLLRDTMDNINYEQFKNMSCSSFLDYLLSLSGNELSLLAIGLGFLLSSNIDNNKQNSLGNFLELMGQTLLTISAQNMVLQSSPSRIELQQQINDLRNQIQELKKLLFK